MLQFSIVHCYMFYMAAQSEPQSHGQVSSSFLSKGMENDVVIQASDINSSLHVLFILSVFFLVFFKLTLFGIFMFCVSALTAHLTNF